MITFKKTFNFYASDNELSDYIRFMSDVMTGDVDSNVEIDVESDSDHRYVTFKIFDKLLH